eukprot:364999-Chlamydomonas_euryale.AAC.32
MHAPHPQHQAYAPDDATAPASMHPDAPLVMCGGVRYQVCRRTKACARDMRLLMPFSRCMLLRSPSTQYRLQFSHSGKLSTPLQKAPCATVTHTPRRHAPFRCSAMPDAMPLRASNKGILCGKPQRLHNHRDNHLWRVNDRAYHTMPCHSLSTSHKPHPNMPLLAPTHAAPLIHTTAQPMHHTVHRHLLSISHTTVC